MDKSGRNAQATHVACSMKCGFLATPAKLHMYGWAACRGAACRGAACRGAVKWVSITIMVACRVEACRVEACRVEACRLVPVFLDIPDGNTVLRVLASCSCTMLCSCSASEMFSVECLQ